MEFLASIKEFLILESTAITQAAEKLNAAQVNQALDLLRSCRGKLILIGVGKSGDVARKIAATFTSTGTFAVFLHPADALHGDLGVVAPGDVALCISNSGETEEILTMLPHMNHREVPIIAIVGNVNSTLGRRANIAFDASVAKEACPFNLAPTTSTTVALAIGDALALATMQAKGRTVKDFAANHPAGKLGKRLTLRVADLMHGGEDLPKVSPDCRWLDVLAAITDGGLGAVAVVGHSDKTSESLIGLVTDGDLRRAVQKTGPQQLGNLTARSIMTTNPVTVPPDLLAIDALKLMENRPRQISVLLVVDNRKECLGLLRLHDVVRSGLS